MDQYNKIKTPEINYYIDFWQRCQDNSMGKNSLSTNDAETTRYPTKYPWSWTLSLEHIKKNNSRYIVELNIKTKTIKLGVENTGGLHDWGKGKAP